MTQPNSIAGFFSGGGGKSVSWKDRPIGTTVTGTILAVHPPQPQTDPVSGDPVINKRTGQPKMQVRIELQTAERDPQDTEDDGRRNLYCGGWLIGAVGDALRKAGAQEPEIGGTLTVQLSERTPNENPALAPINKFQAHYAPPSPAAGFFNQQPAPQQPAVQQQSNPGQFGGQVPQPSFAPGGGYVQQPVQQGAPAPQFAPQPQATPQPQYQQPVPPQGQQPAPVQQQAPAIQKPPGIAQEAWDTMPDATKAAVAATMGGGLNPTLNSGGEPPF